MALFRKSRDPLSERERDLQAKIVALEGQIRGLNQRVAEDQAQPRLRSTARPATSPTPAPPFEDIRPPRGGPGDATGSSDHYNDMGVRKYDLLAVIRRGWGLLRRTPGANPRLVSYLAAGSIHGLRPLRYEKRIARNRFLALCFLFIAILWGLIYFYLRNR